METITGPSKKKNLISFAAVRPSRTEQVMSAPRDLELRRACETAWFAQIGVPAETLQLSGADKTGSPTGSKPPHYIDDLIEDFGPI